MIKLRWNPAQRFSLVMLIDGQRQFTMCAGAFIRFNNFICAKVTNSVRMWEDMLGATSILRASLTSDFKPEAYLMAPIPTFQDPVEMEQFYGDFFAA
jgi:hypothetical protein